ncbi:hypothetical protein QFZ97_002424 [Paraburkholderia youngii]
MAGLLCPFMGRRGDPQYYRNWSIQPQTTGAAPSQRIHDVPGLAAIGPVTQSVYAWLCKLSDSTDVAPAWHGLRPSVSDQAAGGIAWTSFASKGENDV